MTILDDIAHGESLHVECRETLPERAEQYVKTVIAFANTQGGRLFIGVVDDSREVIGVNPNDLFRNMDSIANAISDSCEPQIDFDVEPYTVQGKTIIVVTVPAGTNRPYHLKAKGKDKGTYIRVADTTRLASPAKIHDLDLEGSRRSWDELDCIGYSVTDSAVQKLCDDMNRLRREKQVRTESKERLPSITPTNLENWGVIRKEGNRFVASNAFAVLTNPPFRHIKTQCAVFAGTDRGIFINKQEFTGAIHAQIDAACDYVLRNTRISARIVGLYRRERHEFPPDAIRELIVNAHCHRNYLDESSIQVAVYADHLEFTSPGGLYNGPVELDAPYAIGHKNTNRHPHRNPLLCL